MPDITTTVIGRLTEDPELRFTASGKAVANFSVAANGRFRNKDTGQWEDGEPTFIRCSAWNGYAENITESLSKGDSVILSGKLQQRKYETKNGEQRTVIELVVEDIGPTLQWSTAKPVKANRGNGGSTQAAPSDPWVTETEPPF